MHVLAVTDASHANMPGLGSQACFISHRREGAVCESIGGGMAFDPDKASCRKHAGGGGGIFGGGTRSQ
eukprot:12904708-Prorocentrum_lima.AAC.1